VRLAKDHLLLRAVDGTPGADPALEGAAHAAAEIGMAAQQLVEHGHGPQPRRRLEHRHDLTRPDLGQRIGPATLPWRLLLRGQPWILLEAIGGGLTEIGLGGGHRYGVGLTELHVESHLAIGDRAAGQRARTS
jgi:hypothetical protein